MSDRLEMLARSIAEAAELAFWEKVAELAPGDSGDFPPIDSCEFTNACRKVVDAWLMWNDPRFVRKEDTGEQNGAA